MTYRPKPHMLHFGSLNTAWIHLVQVSSEIAITIAAQNAMALPEREYHSAHHCARMWDTWMALGQETHLRKAVATAIIFHDAVYKPGAEQGHNERASAELLRQNIIVHPDVPSDHSVLALDMIYASGDHWGEDYSVAQQMFCDLDLFALCCRFDEFIYNNTLIRREFKHVSDEQFIEGQIKLFTGWLEQPSIYRSGMLPQWCEASAIENLDRALHLLESHDAPWAFREN